MIVYKLSYMQKSIYCFLICLLVINVLFSQTVEENRAFQFDKIISQTMGGKEFMISVGLSYNPRGEQVYILKRVKDSFWVTSYVGAINNDIGDVYSVFVNDDTLFKKTIDSLYSDIQQKHSYTPYSPDALKGGYFFLTFFENDKLQVFGNNEASQSQTKYVDFIIKRLSAHSVSPFGGHNIRKKYLNVQNWNELVNYLKSSTVNSQPK